MSGEGDAQQSNAKALRSNAMAEQPKNNLKRRNTNE